MGELLARLHRAHVERQQKFFRHEPVMQRIIQPIEHPEPIQQLEPIITEQIEGAPIAPATMLSAMPNRISVKTIIRRVAQRYEVTYEDIVGSRRCSHFVIPRHTAMFLAKELTKSSFPEIGRRFGNRDHTTVLHAFHKVKKCIETDQEFARFIAQLRSELVPGPADAI